MGGYITAHNQSGMVKPVNDQRDVLAKMAPHERQAILACMEPKRFAAGACIMHQGDDANGCLLITDGTARVQLDSEDAAAPVLLGYLGPGELVGEPALFGIQSRSASVYADSEVSALWLEREKFGTLERTSPEVAMAFKNVLECEAAPEARDITDRLMRYVSPETSLSEARRLAERAVAGHSHFASRWTAEFLADVPTEKDIVDSFLAGGIDTFCLVGDSIFSTMDQYIMDLAAEGKANRWVVPSERSIPAVAVGRWLATGKITVMSMQNTGFTNAMDYLRTVMLVHRIPGLVMSGWRGFDRFLDDSEPHTLVGNATDADNRNTFADAHVFGQRSGVGLLRDVRKAIADAQQGNLACLRMSPPGFSRSYPLRSVADSCVPRPDLRRYAATVERKGLPYEQVRNEPPLDRDDALRKIHQEMKSLDPFYIVGNGFNPRAMQALRLTENTFENSGGMGSSLAIAWGAAKSDPSQVFVAIDGDQNAVMNEMEKVLSSDYPDNLYWFILDNGTGESVGTSLSLPLSPWHYELARVINTRNQAPGSFKYSRINASGLKFDDPAAAAMARELGSLPAQAHVARRLLQRKLDSRAKSAGKT